MRDQQGMGRFEWTGTVPEYINLAAIPALTLHSSLAPARKAARLRYLASIVRKHVSSSVSDARFYATGDPAMTCALTAVEIPGVDPASIQKTLRERHGILVQGMGGIRSDPGLRAFRVSPNVYTPMLEIDRFGAALASEIKSLRAAR